MKGAKEVAIVGATGVVGQQFIVGLALHPWFRIAGLAASGRSAGLQYADALSQNRQGSGWYCEDEPTQEILRMKIQDASNLDPTQYDFVFSAMGPEEAKVLEPKFAKHVPVVSTASAFRYEKDVPILLPGINDDHLGLIDVQRKLRGWEGFIVPQPNCTTVGLATTLRPILDNFGLSTVLMTSLQAVSGAGRSPGVLSLDILDNIVPYIPGEEEKVQTETLKIMGSYNGKEIVPADFKVSCTCTRVNVKDGHTESVFTSTEKKCTVDDVISAMENFDGISKSKFPSAPPKPIVVRRDPYRPQPRLDRDTFGGMATVVGRIRVDDALSNGIKYLLVSHNTKAGAAKGAILTAELLCDQGLI